MQMNAKRKPDRNKLGVGQIWGVTKYIKDILKKHGMTNAKIMSTRMHPSSSLDKDEKGISTSEKEYRGMIGSLLYLTASRLDIVFSVGLCARFQTDPKESHLTV